MMIVIWALVMTPRPALMASDYYKGKTLELVVAMEPGSGQDIATRVLARHLGKFIPGKPTVIVKNMPGGGATIGANYVYNIAKPDGLTVLSGAGKNAMGGLVKVKGVKYDYKTMTPVLAIPFGAVGYAKADLVDKPEDIIKAKEVFAGGSSLPSMTTTFQLLTWNVLGYRPKKIILAYRGTGDARLAFLSGEINFMSETAAGFTKKIRPLVKKGEVVPIWTSGLMNEAGQVIREPAMADIQTLKELYQKIYNKSPSGSAWDAYRMVIATVANMSKTLLFPKGAEKYAAIVAEGCKKMVKDPNFQKDIAKLAPGNPVYVGQKLMDLWKVSLEASKPEVVKWIRNWLNQEYGVELEPLS